MYVIYRVEKFTRFPRQLSGLMHQPIETQQESSRCTLTSLKIISSTLDK